MFSLNCETVALTVADSISAPPHNGGVTPQLCTDFFVVAGEICSRAASDAGQLAVPCQDVYATKPGREAGKKYNKKQKKLKPGT